MFNNKLTICLSFVRLTEAKLSVPIEIMCE